MIYIVLFLVSFTLTYLVKEYAIKKSLLAQVNERSSHSVPTPHGGGIAVGITWLLALLYLFFTHKIEDGLFFALITGFIISFIGFVDDLVEVKPKIRMVIFSFVAVLGLYFIGGLEKIDFGIFEIKNILITTIFAILLIIWYINLTNFIDGIDSYLALEIVFLSIAGFILFSGDIFIALLVSVLGFLYWNWHRAKIFMGDVGSTMLGYNIAIITLYYANIESNNLWIWIVLFSLFWFDATLTLVRRFKNGEKLSQAHKKHAYQRLTQSGWSHTKVTSYAMGLNILLFCIVYFTKNIAVSFFIVLLLLHSVMRFVDSKKSF